MPVKTSRRFSRLAILVLEQLQPPSSIAKFLVVESVDVFKVAVEGKEELCDVLDE